MIMFSWEDLLLYIFEGKSWNIVTFCLPILELFNCNSNKNTNIENVHYRYTCINLEGKRWTFRASVEVFRIQKPKQGQPPSLPPSLPRDPNGRVTTPRMNAPINCVWGLRPFMALWRSFGVAAKQTPLSFQLQRAAEETHILNTCGFFLCFLLICGHMKLRLCAPPPLFFPQIPKWNPTRDWN